LNQLKCETLATLGKVAEVYQQESDCIIFITESFAPERETAGLKQIGEMMKEFLIQRGVPPEKIVISAETSVETRGKVESFFAYLEKYKDTGFKVFLPVPKYYKKRAMGRIKAQSDKAEVMVSVEYRKVKVPFRCLFSEYSFNLLVEPIKGMKSEERLDKYEKEERKARENHKIKK